MGRSARCGFLIALCALLSTTNATPLLAQWRLEAQAGRLQYEAAPDAASTSLGVGLGHFTVHSGFSASVGVPLSDEEPIWGALHGSRRLISRGDVRYGIDLAGNGFGYRLETPDSLGPIETPGTEPVTGWGVAVEAFPLIAMTRGPLTAQARAGVVHFTTRADGEGYDRDAFVSDLSLIATPIASMSFALDASWVSVSQGAFPYAGIGATWTRGVTVWGSVGKWFDDAITTVSWNAGGSAPIGERVALIVSGRHDALDPVYATPARTTWGAGVTVLLGETRATVAEPVPAAYRDGIATIAIDDDVVEGRPSIAGDFNDWTPAPMTQRDGGWVYDVAVAPGVYSYAFVDEAGTWFVPEGTPGRRDDGMGGHVAVLVVDS